MKTLLIEYRQIVTLKARREQSFIGGPIINILQDNTDLSRWLARQSERSTLIASNCTGAFLLAESGLLNGREATTHWGYSDQFRQRYPDVLCHPEKLITVDGPIACAGGGMARWDLGVHLVERYAGVKVARELAKAFVIDAGRTSQAPYSALQARRYHTDAPILRLQKWLHGHFDHPVSLKIMCEISNLTERFLIRRFKTATGDGPTNYLQLLRIESARHGLETTQQSVEQITQSVGYEDVSSFSRLFRKQTGLSPGAYRSRFGR